MPFFLIVVLFFLSLQSTAQATTVVYKCDIKGVTTFSQFPCAKDAEEIKIKPTNVAHVNQQEKQNSANRMGASSIANAIDMRTRQLKSQIDPQIDNLEQKIKTLTAQKKELQSKVRL